VSHSRKHIYRTEADSKKLLPHLPAIRALADSEREALGFLPEVAYREAIEKKRLIAMLVHSGNPEIAGFVLFGGVFPNARVQQIVVANAHRGAGIASALINEVVSRLEVRGYLTISAKVAADLPKAQAFYENCGFIARHSRRGGQARNRTIIVRMRDLATPSLLSMLSPYPTTPNPIADLGLQFRAASPAPLYVIDLNVLFDVVKPRRPRSTVARRLIASALRHQVRLAVAPEFVVELERTTRGEAPDPVLELARQLPRLPSSDRAETDALASLVHKIVFVDAMRPDAGSAQAVSDARHLAQAALARASCYVTSDGRMLDARDHLLQQVGIDVASLEEFDVILPSISHALEDSPVKGTHYTVASSPPDPVRAYLQDHGVGQPLISEFAPLSIGLESWRAHTVLEGGEIVAVGIGRASGGIDAPIRVLVHVRSDHVSCDVLADHLVDLKCREACRDGPAAIELPFIAGQSVVRRAAGLRGFLVGPDNQTMVKVAVGRPITAAGWPSIAKQTRRRTGLRLPETPPTTETLRDGMVVQGPDGRSVLARLSMLEDALAPTILVWPGRRGAILPINRTYADDLLGTGDQFPLFGSPEAAFITRRAYFNSPRSARLLRPGLPILFYESLRSGGRGAVVAAARIVDATVLQKPQVSEEMLRRGVIEDVNLFSSSSDVLMTVFDSVLCFPNPVSLRELRALGAVNAGNFRTATALSPELLESILERGWSRG
jgi:ribosomal protein S18 acetylase RimI-like enzyme/predicted nucleic acid-binding protein